MAIVKSGSILIALLWFLMGCSAGAQAGSSMRQRVQRVKESTVRILVNGSPAGTGFAVAANLVATNFHVVQQVSPAAGGQTQVGFAGKIEVQLQDGRVLPATPHPSVLGSNMQAAVGRDIALLTVTINDLRPLRLGRFADASEGDIVYLAGYPFGVEQIIVATGMLSTKWKTGGYLGQGGARDVVAVVWDGLVF